MSCYFAFYFMLFYYFFYGDVNFTFYNFQKMHTYLFSSSLETYYVTVDGKIADRSLGIIAVEIVVVVVAIRFSILKRIFLYIYLVSLNIAIL